MIHNKFRYLLTLVALFAMTAGAWAAQVELKLGAKIKNGDVLTFGDTRVHFTTPCSRPYAIFSAVNTSTNVTIGYDENAQLGYMLNDTYIAFTPLVDVSKGQDDCFSGEGESLGLYTGQTIPEYVMVTDGTGTYADPFILTSYATYNCGGSPVDGKAICDASDPSALKVDWNKASKTGTFKMPGGNVELEPEYYPQAALTAQPTAINNVPATTDGAIVKAGTVKNIGETTTAQGTVMYYVSTTALDDAALLALAADKWTADVPTAETLAQGQAYVYYYVRGNDSDTDETTFSDGDIMPLGTNGLVTIAAAPTYAVTFAEGVNPEPPAEPEWTASPNAGVKKGTEVTVTYTGSKKVLGVKAEKKKVAEGHALPLAKFGEIVCSDGKAYAAADKDNLPKGVKAEALVCYVNGEHGLALAMADVKNAKMSWDNDRGANDGKTAAEWCDGWNTSHPIAGATWLLASQTQWNNMISAAGSASNLSNAFSAVGGTNLQAWSYWSSTPNHGGTAAWFYYFPQSSWQWTYLNQDYTGRYIRACLEW